MARMPIPFNNPRTYAGHSGVDFPQARGTHFRASGPGKVTHRNSNSRGGNIVWVHYDNGVGVGYAHLDNYTDSPAPGTRVQEGTVLGRVGSSGFSTGPHLHAEVANHATTAGFWQFFDPSRTVGGGSTAGGSPSGGGMWSDTRKQQFLVSIGLDTGGVGNGWGPASKAATEAFQNAVGLPVDGVFGPNTTSVAQVIEAGKNITSRPVADIQAKVGVPADGVWGNQTSFGTYRWQRANGVDADAIWGPASDSKAFGGGTVTPPPATGTPAFPLPAGQWFGPEAGGNNSISGWHSGPGGHPGLRQYQTQMAARGWQMTIDGLYGPMGATTPQGNTADITIAFQKEKGLNPDGLIGPDTWRAAWEAPVTPPVTPPDVPVEPVPPTVDDEAKATPDIKTPTASDFPIWIQYEEKFDQQMSADPLWNKHLQDYYKKPYQPIESHTHWWGLPGQSGTHDGNVNYLNSTKDVGANYVTSEGRITLTAPLNKIALTTGSRNPYAWKSENDPNITTSVSDMGYKTLGYLHYIVEKLNPELLNEPIRLHKEVLPGTTQCSNIDTAKVRAFAEAFRTGALDPRTGFPPAVVDPEPEPADEKLVPVALISEIEAKNAELTGLIEKL